MFKIARQTLATVAPAQRHCCSHCTGGADDDASRAHALASIASPGMLTSFLGNLALADTRVAE
jgi:hypothetical protein